jgi:DNA-binding response OmpR family regulator
MSTNNNRRILVVDDESDVNLALKIALEDNGFKVDTFTDPMLALKNFRDTSMYDLIILDILMSGMSGLELYREIKKVDDKVKVCFLTAILNYEEEVRRAFPTLNRNQFIRKPIDNEELIKQINNMISSN